MPLSPFFIKGAGVQNIPFTGVMGPALHLPAQPGPREQRAPATGWHRGGPPAPTRLVLVLDVEAGDDAVPVEPLSPSQVHAPGFHLADLQLRRVRGLLGRHGGSRAKARGDRERKKPEIAGPCEALPHPTPRARVCIPSAALVGSVTGSAHWAHTHGHVPWTVSWIRPLSSPYELIA